MKFYLGIPWFYYLFNWNQSLVLIHVTFFLLGHIVHWNNIQKRFGSWYWCRAPWTVSLSSILFLFTWLAGSLTLSGAKSFCNHLIILSEIVSCTTECCLRYRVWGCLTWFPTWLLDEHNWARGFFNSFFELSRFHWLLELNNQTLKKSCYWNQPRWSADESLFNTSNNTWELKHCRPHTCSVDSSLPVEYSLLKNSWYICTFYGRGRITSPKGSDRLWNVDLKITVGCRTMST